MDNVTDLREYTRRMAKAKRLKGKSAQRDVPAALKALRERSGLSMGQMAKHLGYRGASSYQRYEDPGLFTKDYLPPDLVQRMASALVGRGTPPITREEVFALGLWGRETFPESDTAETRFTPMPVLGEVEAGVWRDVADIDTAPLYGSIPVLPTPYLPDQGQYGLLVRGESMNRVAKDGDYLACVDVHWIEMKPQSGDLVVVERVRGDGSIREVTVKRLFQEFDGTRILMPESDDPRFQQPIPLDEPGSSDVVVSIKAIVLMVLSIKHRAALFDRQGRSGPR